MNLQTRTVSQQTPAAHRCRLHACPHSQRHPLRPQRLQPCRAESRDQLEEQMEAEKKKDPGFAFSALWNVAEQFGNAVGLTKGKKQQAGRTAGQSAALPKMSRTEAIEEIKNDYRRNYFISGTGEMQAYEDQCLFADPFSAFRGVSRFKKNVSNFSGLISNVDLKIRKFEEQPDYVRSFWVFSASIKLPWNPRIAAKGYTTHVFNKENRIIYHKEDWDTEPTQVIRQLFSRGREPRA